MITQDLTDRIPIALLPTRLNETAYLVEGKYVPLRPSIGLTCRFCGIGKYVKHKLHGGHFHDFDLQDARSLRCEHCGHMEFFASQNIADPEWWQR